MAVMYQLSEIGKFSNIDFDSGITTKSQPSERRKRNMILFLERNIEASFKIKLETVEGTDVGQGIYGE